MNGNLTMENMAQSFPISKHVSGESKAGTNQRLVRIIAKKDSKGNYASAHLMETKSVSIPMIGKDEITPQVITRFMPQIIEMFNGFQDALIADKVKSEGVLVIRSADISMDAISQYLNSANSVSRSNKETIAAWFMESYAEIAIEFICTALKWDIGGLSTEQELILESKIGVLKDMFSGFASGKYNPDDARCKAMIKFVEFTGDAADSQLQGYKNRAIGIMAKREEELSSNALGF